MPHTGYVHLYTGGGKGKTTAAVGLAFRAAGHGMKSLIIQFMKGRETGEAVYAENSGGIVSIEQYGEKAFIDPRGASPHQIDLFMVGYKRAEKVLSSGKYGLIVLDELASCPAAGLASTEDIIRLIKGKRDRTELVITGRNAPAELYPFCDLITEMKEVKHYYNTGVKSREGIEY